MVTLRSEYEIDDQRELHLDRLMNPPDVSEEPVYHCTECNGSNLSFGLMEAEAFDGLESAEMYSCRTCGHKGELEAPRYGQALPVQAEDELEMLRRRPGRQQGELFDPRQYRLEVA